MTVGLGSLMVEVFEVHR